MGLKVTVSTDHESSVVKALSKSGKVLDSWDIPPHTSRDFLLDGRERIEVSLKNAS